eukprot:COSAG01_NODE_18883_length_1047_cov_0.880802_2_plen_99_part_01
MGISVSSAPWTLNDLRDLDLRQPGVHTWVRSTATQRRAACPGVSIPQLFRDKNRGGIGKSQPKWTARTTEAPGPRVNGDGIGKSQSQWTARTMETPGSP